jgi:hypothetical protein
MNYKTLFVNNVLYIIDYFHINHILIGHWIRAFHYNSPIYLFIFMCILSKFFCKFMLLFFFIFIIFFFILFKGCWISSLENKLLKDNINICDIFLDFLNIKINNKNRFHITLLIGFFYTLLLLFVYYIRFIIFNSL